MKVLRILVGILLVAVVGLVVALVVTTSGASSNHADQAQQIRALRSEIAGVRKTAVAAQKMAINTGTQDVTRVKSDVTRLKQDLDDVQASQRSASRRLTSVTDCLPEVQAEMNSMNVDRFGILSIDSQVSRPCQKVVYPPGDAADR